MNDVRIIFIGDIVGRPGRKAVKESLSVLLAETEAPTIVIANAENAAGGFGLTKKIYGELNAAGVDIFTGGNHIWDKSDVSRERDSFKMLATPVNLRAKFPPLVVHTDLHGLPLTVFNIAGRVFMPQGASDPFQAFDEIYEKEKCAGRAVIVDFHAEATSEKVALAEYAKGRATAVIGTHTHVQTADERILTNGTFFLSDAGSCCAVNSILGMTVESSLARFFSPQPQRMQVAAEGPLMFNGVEIYVNCDSLRVTSFRRLYRIMEQE